VKELIKQPRAIGIPKKTFTIGGKVLEKDLYEFMVKYEKQKDFGNIISEITETREPLMKDIESRAKMKFINYTEKKKQESYMLPHALTVKAKNMERNKGQFDEENQQSFSRMIRIPSSTKNTFALRSSRVDTSKESYSAYFPPDSLNNKRSLVRNESFASNTEIQLDQLYRKSHHIQKTITALDEKMEKLTYQDQEKFSKFEAYKEQKLNALRLNSKEAIRVATKKIREKSK